MIVINPELLQAFREKTQCEWCKKTIWTGLQACHIYAKGHGGGFRVDIKENLVALCYLCHARQHNENDPTRAQLLEVVALREGRTVEDIEATIRRIQEEDKCDVWRVPSDRPHLRRDSRR